MNRKKETVTERGKRTRRWRKDGGKEEKERIIREEARRTRGTLKEGGKWKHSKGKRDHRRMWDDKL